MTRRDPDDLFNRAQLDVLRAGMARIDRADPDSDSYKRMIRLLDGMSIPQLRQIRGAGIKFMSPLALNRLIRRKAV